MATRMGRHHMNQKDITRLTVGGRRITYQLKVIQEPERARACGSGAKSSADRRPVDPPPVVELRIFEGDGPDREDITFGYSANFFLFATLEVARPIANGRMHPPAQQQVPVLTGMPVSGMAYLDRPTEAGYFIFPDLSVRHEGAYKLSFNLYEETKNPEDADVESHEKKQQIPTSPGAPDSSFDWRLEVKSNAFTVYSAKKFPGLSESTTLSRTVAEQGCRVRIRRDVRMRRREGKTTGDYEEAPEDTYSRGRPAEQDPYRSRSNSGTPHGTPESSPNRGGEFPQQYSQYPPHPHQAQPGSAGILGFGPPGSQYQNSQPFAAPQAPSHQQYQQPQGAPSYAQQPPPPPPQQQYRAPAPQPSYNHERQHPQSAFPSHPPREAFEPEPRRASLAYPPSHASRDFPPMETSFNRQQPYQPPSYARPRSPPPPTQAPLSLPPIVQSRPLDPKANLPSPLAPVNSIAPFPSESYDRVQERSASYSYAPQPPAMEPPRSGKRAYDSVFKSPAQPLFNGQRPVSSHANDAYEDDDEMSLATMKMDYKRANGKFNTRVLPTLD